jgi:eukaryotic-like serine/threonine-protein kinase
MTSSSSVRQTKITGAGREPDVGRNQFRPRARPVILIGKSEEAFGLRTRAGVTLKPLEPGDPQTLGQYRLLRMLGAGGMGKVFLGRSAQGRTVAVKLIHPQLALDPDFRNRFRREIAAAQRVGGEWTAPVLDFDTEGEIPWVATGYIAGPSLYDIVTQSGVLPEHTLWRLAEGLAHALTAIHDSGLVHRDLKPSNVLATVDGPRVIDFGIARAVGGSVLTSTGAVIGSPGYMSPEQVRGETLGPASDVFSLGATLTYAATGVGPHDTEDGAAHALMYRVINEPPHLRDLAGPLRELVAACLAKDPGERPAPHEIAAAARAHCTSGPWLPARLTDQLLRETVQLLSIEEPARDAAAGDPSTASGASDASETMQLRAITEPVRGRPAGTPPPTPPAVATDTARLRAVTPSNGRPRSGTSRGRRSDAAIVVVAVVGIVAMVLAVTLGLLGTRGGWRTEADAGDSHPEATSENGSGDVSPGQPDEGSDEGSGGDPSKDPDDDPSGSPSDDPSDDGSSEGQGDTTGGSSDGGSSSGGSVGGTSDGSSGGSVGGTSDGSTGGSSDGSSGGSVGGTSDGSSGGSSDGSSGGTSDGSSGGSSGGASGGGDGGGEPPEDDGLNGRVSEDMVGTWESSPDKIIYDGSSFSGHVLGCDYYFELESVDDGGRSVSLSGENGCGAVDVNVWLEGADTAGMNAFDELNGSMSATLYRVS